VKERAAYVPAVTVNVNKDKVEPVKGHKLFIDNAQVLVGVNSDSTVISRRTSRSPTTTATAVWTCYWRRRAATPTSSRRT